MVYLMVIDLINVRVFRCLLNGMHMLCRIGRMYEVCYETTEYGKIWSRFIFGHYHSFIGSVL